jgi:small subunit ribosomal protein S9
MTEENLEQDIQQNTQENIKQQDASVAAPSLPKNTIWATGRRKKSIARVRLIPGNGEIQVNKKPLDEYFDRPTSRLLIRQPLKTTNLINKFNIIATVRGGGKSGQAGALRHGISRALALTSGEIKTLLRRKGFLTRDPRVKERKKYGQKGARKRFQWTKR